MDEQTIREKVQTIKGWFQKHNKEYLKFENIERQTRLSNRRDLCAMNLLDKLCPADTVYDSIVSGAEHDKIFLGVTLRMLAECKELTKEHILYLVRCGIRIDSDENLAMFV